MPHALVFCDCRVGTITYFGIKAGIVGIIGIFGMGDIGGILEFTLIVFGFFIYPISEHSFFLRASRQMFFARTKDKSLFL